jgi:membrane dipeptidase
VRFAIDAHVDTVQRIVDLGESFTSEGSAAEVSLAKARAGGLGAQLFSIWVDPAFFPGEAGWPRARRLVEGLCAEVDRDGGALALARTGADVRAARDDGKFAVLMGLEGAHALGQDGLPLSIRLGQRLAELAEHGVRYLAPTWSNSNDFGGSSNDKGRDRGLSELGWALLEACHATEILCDVSHVSDPSFNDMAAWSRSTGWPIVASHSSARALAGAPRNLTDGQLHVIADCGGVASVNFCPSFLDDEFRKRSNAVCDTPEARAAQEAAKQREPDAGRASLAAWAARSSFARALTPPSVDDVARHVVHMLVVAGEDHVGLGSDFDGIAAVPRGLEDVSRLPALAEALTARQVPSRVIDKVFAENWLRVLDV